MTLEDASHPATGSRPSRRPASAPHPSPPTTSSPGQTTSSPGQTTSSPGQTTSSPGQTTSSPGQTLAGSPAGNLRAVPRP